MLSPRWRKVLVDVWGNKTRTALVVLSIAVGVFAIGMIAGSEVVLSRDLPAAYAAVNPSSATLFIDPADEDFIASIGHMRGVKAAEGRRSLNVRVKVGEKDWRGLQLVAYADFDHIEINKIRPVTGAWPPPRREMLMERASLSFLGATVGDRVRIELTDGKQYELRVAGVVHDLNEPPPFFTGSGYAYVNLDTLEWLGTPANFNELNLLVAEKELDKEHIQAVAKQVSDRVEKSGRTVHYTYIADPGKHPADDQIRTFLMLLGALGLLSLVLSGFLVVNTIAALLTQQTRQIGMMKAIGARGRQIAVMYLATVLLLGFLALVIGAVLGTLGAYGLSSYLAGLVNFDPTSMIPPLHVFALQAAVGLTVPVLAAIYPVFNGTRITVREALSTYNAGQGKAEPGFTDRVIDRMRILSRPLLLSLRNTFRRKGRLALTLITLTLGGAIFVAVFNVNDSLLLTLDDALRYFRFDVEVRLRAPARPQEIEQLALSIPGVTRVETINVTSARRIGADGKESRNFNIFALPTGSRMIEPTILDGRWLLPEDENALVLNTAVVKNDPGLKVGDEIVLKIDGRENTWRVVGLARSAMTGPIAYVNVPYYRQLARVRGTSMFWMQIDRPDAAGRNQIIAATKESFKAAGMPVSSTEAMADLRSQVQAQFNAIIFFLLIMAVLLAVVGGLGLMGTMSLNVLERTREIGVMRAIGASDGAVQKVVIVEGILIGMISWLVGTGVAYPLGKVLSDTVGNTFMQAALNYAFSLSGTLLWLVVVVVLATLASLLPARRASRLSVREVLAYE